jgi:hypothetical protein
MIVEKIADDCFVVRHNGCSGGGSTLDKAKENLEHALINDRIMNPEKYKEKVTLVYDRSNNKHYSYTR